MSCKLIPVVNSGAGGNEYGKRAGLTVLGRFMWEAVLLALFAGLSASFMGVCSTTLGYLLMSIYVLNSCTKCILCRLIRDVCMVSRFLVV